MVGASYAIISDGVLPIMDAERQVNAELDLSDVGQIQVERQVNAELGLAAEQQVHAEPTSLMVARLMLSGRCLQRSACLRSGSCMQSVTCLQVARFMMSGR